MVWHECSDCHGTGRSRKSLGIGKCPDCDGSGTLIYYKRECGDSIEYSKPCRRCDGSGRIELYQEVKCTTCGGERGVEWYE